MLPLNFGGDLLNEGDYAQLTCVVIGGDEPLALSWSFHGHDIDDSSALGIQTRNIGSRTSLLIIESVGHKHRGNYTCKASNLAGIVNEKAELRVNGRDFFSRRGKEI